VKVKPVKVKPVKVKHVYHDYVSQLFPVKLMRMLDRETVNNPDVITWCPHGSAFIVRKPKVLTAEVMINYFWQSKLTSFQRQLNLYGFRRITHGLDAGAYYHELFLRGRPDLITKMVRQKVDASTEPDFYSMQLDDKFVIDLSDIPPQPPIPKTGYIKRGASNYIGVSYDKLMNKWRAQIRIHGKSRVIGFYDDEERAAVDYARALFKFESQDQEMLKLLARPRMITGRSRGPAGRAGFVPDSQQGGASL
jgi:hypothetical protein